PGVSVPDEIGRRLRGVPPDRVADEGLRLCAEIIQQVLALPGVSGVHVMAPGFEHGVPAILEAAGVPPRPRLRPAAPARSPAPAASGQERSGHAD
ncbi:MAG: methylenetetrahydrofolate reductase, partial [Actinobacteria bacterium]|nr:methylenetetrahydrofolate reductase [Actinomycetota bacterium]